MGKLLDAPYVYFGGKSAVAEAVWARFGYDVPNFIDSFTGSSSILLKRPGWKPGVNWDEIINDFDGMIANFWRSVKYSPNKTAGYADNPVNENDLHARHAWLVGRKKSLRELLEGDPEYHDPRIAGWWVWGMSCWIGSQFCGGKGAWGVEQNDEGQKVLIKKKEGIVYRKRIQLGGQGVNKSEVSSNRNHVYKWFKALSDRLRTVKVACGDWTRVTSEFVTLKKDKNVTAVFLDPPYSKEADRNSSLYSEEDLVVAHNVREWCVKNGNNNSLRIALCGYDIEHEELGSLGWERYNWKSLGGYSVQGKNSKGRENRDREVIWFSPHCLKTKQVVLL